ncbi:MAG: ABC transporter substrate-binding protein [Pseudomonadota bacterium]
MKTSLKAAVLALGLATAIAPAARAEEQKINISYQPSLYWALPFYIASEKGWWKEVGLAPSFATFPAGAPQVAAAQASSWDVGGTGSVPAVLGAARFGLMTIGITNDESKTNAIMARGDKVEALRKDPKKLAGQKLLLTTNSTADYAARNCLKKWGLSSSDMQFVNLGQAQIISAMISNNGDVVGVWAPNTYTLEEKAGAKVLCSGADAGAVVPGALVVRADYAKQNPEAVAKVLAVYVRAWGWAKAHPKEAKALAKQFYAQGGGRGIGRRDRPGICPAPHLLPRRTAAPDGSQQGRLGTGRLAVAHRHLHERCRHHFGLAGPQNLCERQLHEAGGRRSQAEGVRDRIRQVELTPMADAPNASAIRSGAGLR